MSTNEPYPGLIEAGVIERLSDGRIRLTESAWRCMSNATSHIAHSEPPPSQPARSINKHERY